MSWLTYYKLLEKYDGDLSKATLRELDVARRANPNTPDAARELAVKKWREDKKNSV